MNYKLFGIMLLVLTCLAIVPTVSAYSIRFTFYDENSTNLVPSVAITDSNGSTYTSDIAGLWDVNLTGEKSFDFSKTGYSTRSFDFNFIADANYNFLLNPTTLDSNIIFLVKNNAGTVWSNKFLYFNSFKSLGNTPDTNQYIYSALPTSNSQTEYAGYIVQPNTKLKIYSVLKDSSCTATDVNLMTSAGVTLTQATFVGNVATFSSMVDLNQDTNYWIVAGKGGATYTARYKTAVSFPVDNNYLDYKGRVTYGVGIGYTDYYNLLDINVIIGKNAVAESIKTNSVGNATAHISPTNDYNALLYDSNGILNNTYIKTTVTVLKPKNEKTLALVSPWDLLVGGTLTYSDTNNTDANIPIMIFGGTTTNYDFTLKDTADLYIPRVYSVNNPWGSSYNPAYTFQPYLLDLNSGIVPTIRVLDVINRPINNALVNVYKNIGGTLTLVESSYTTSVGEVSFSGYPLDKYYIYVYYNGELKGSYNVITRTSADIFYFVIDVLGTQNPFNFVDFWFDWSATLDSFNITSSNVDVSVDVNAISHDVNIPVTFTGYTISAIQNGATKGSSTVAFGGHSQTITATFNKAIFDTNSAFSQIQLVVSYDYNGVSYTRSSSKSIYTYIYSRTLTDALGDFPTESGHLWAIILAIFITILTIASFRVDGISPSTTVTIAGILILGIFLTVGWLNTGVQIPAGSGIDISVYIYCLSVIAGIYFIMNSNNND